MKKIICLLMVLCMGLSAAGCSKTDSDGSSKVENESLLSQEDESGESVSSEEDTEETGSKENEVVEEPENQMEAFNQTATLEEMVMYDEGDIKITATGLTYSNYDVELELLIENNTEKDLSFISGSLGYSCNSVNGYMTTDGYLNCDVAAGKKANDSISFEYDKLMLYGIYEIADIEIGFDISDEDYDSIYTGPCQIKTSAYESYDYSNNHYQSSINNAVVMSAYEYDMMHFSTDCLYEDNGVKMLSQGIMVSADGEKLLLLEFENTTESNIYLRAGDISLNGLKVTDGTWTSEALNAGKKGILGIEITNVLEQEFMDLFGMNEIGSVKFTLMQKDADGNELTDEAAIEIIIPDVDQEFDVSGEELYNNNGLRIILKGLLEDSAEYSDDVNMILLMENSSGKTLRIDDEYDSLSVNGYMTDYLFFGREIEDGESVLQKLEIQDSSLEENKIGSVEDIKNIEVSFEIKAEREVLDTPVIAMSFE